MSSVIRGGSCSIKNIILCSVDGNVLHYDKAKWCLDLGETCVYGACILWCDLRSIIESTIPAEPLRLKSEDFLSFNGSASSGFLLTVIFH
jgi:hypothetical protein